MNSTILKVLCISTHYEGGFDTKIKSKCLSTINGETSEKYRKNIVNEPVE